MEKTHVDKLLEKEPIDEFRTVHEYVIWFESILEATRKDKDAQKDDTDALLHKGFYSEFYEEIFPIGRLILSKLNDWEGVTLKNVIGNQCHDVLISGESFHLDYLEITCTTFDDGELFRMKKLLEDGIVSGTGDAIRDNNGKVQEISNCASNRSKAVDKEIYRIKNRILAKSKKTTYPENIGLVVHYNDHHFNDSDYDQVEDACNQLYDEWSKTFDVLYAVGVCNHRLIEIPKRA